MKPGAVGNESLDQLTCEDHARVVVKTVVNRGSRIRKCEGIVVGFVFETLVPAPGFEPGTN